jgi:hypothetical protein
MLKLTRWCAPMVMTTVFAGWAFTGCAGEETDQELFDRLPAIDLGGLSSLPDCGDMLPQADDVVVRLATPSGADIIVLLRDGTPLCWEALAEWLGNAEDPSGAAAGGVTDSGDRGQPPRDYTSGPRPIPWVNDQDDPNGGSHHLGR